MLFFKLNDHFQETVPHNLPKKQRTWVMVKITIRAAHKVSGEYMFTAYFEHGSD